MKSVFDELLIEQTQLKKESMILRILQQKLSKRKANRKKMDQNIQEVWENIKREILVYQKYEKKGTEDIFETILTDNFLKLVSDTKVHI